MLANTTVPSSSESLKLTRQNLPVSDLNHYAHSLACVNSDTNFRETWETAPAYVCGRAKKVFRHPARPEYKLPALFCGRWDCPVCRKKLVRKWQKCLEGKIRAAAASGKQLYLVIASEGFWSALHRALCRRKAQYARFSTAPLKLIVAIDGGGPIATAGAVSTTITPDQAIQLAKALCQIVAKTGQGAKRITTCRKWKLPPRPRSPEKWIEVTVIEATWQEVEAAVRKFRGRLSIENEDAGGMW